MNSTDSQDSSQPSERLHLTDDGLYPPESFWNKQDEERPEAEALQQEAADQKFLDRQLEQLDAAKDFAILTLGKNDNRARQAGVSRLVRRKVRQAAVIAQLKLFAMPPWRFARDLKGCARRQD